jgi:class 3 adenylate cyclase
VLPAIQVPTLVMTSAGSPDLEEARGCAGMIAGSAFIEIPGSDLLPFWSCAERVMDEVSRFVAKVHHEEAFLERVLTTVLFTDIVGSTRKATAVGDRAWRELVEHHHTVVRAMLGRYRGVEQDVAGDGFFATFEGPARGVKCAQAIVDAVRPLELEVRAGIHTGEVGTAGGKASGIAVNVAARIAALAGPSEILVSQTVKDLVAGSGLRFHHHGRRELTGIEGARDLFAVAASRPADLRAW